MERGVKEGGMGLKRDGEGGLKREGGRGGLKREGGREGVKEGRKEGRDLLS